MPLLEDHPDNVSAFQLDEPSPDKHVPPVDRPTLEQTPLLEENPVREQSHWYPSNNTKQLIELPDDNISVSQSV